MTIGNQYFRFILGISLILSTVASCKSTENTSKQKKASADAEVVKEIEKLKIDKNLELVEEEMAFRITGATLNENIITFRVEYGGGCVEPHDFDLVSAVSIKEDGIVDVYLLDKTENDLCKMLVMEEYSFDINKVTRLRSKKLKGFRVNDAQIFMTVKK